MYIIIDGYNFIFRVYGFGQAELQEVREKFLLRLQNYIEKKKVKIEVVFDSREKEFFPSVSSRDRLKIVFSQDADDYIRNVVEDSHNPASILVVSSDGEIIRGVSKHGAKIESPMKFDMLLNKNVCRMKESPDDEKPSPESMTKGEITAWLREFEERKG